MISALAADLVLQFDLAVLADALQAHGEAPQARDVAQLAAQRSLYDTRSADQYMIWKSQEITKEYDAYLIIVDRYRNVIPIGDETVVDGGDMTLEETFTYLGRVLAGETTGAFEKGSLVLLEHHPFVLRPDEDERRQPERHPVSQGRDRRYPHLRGRAKRRASPARTAG